MGEIYSQVDSSGTEIEQQQLQQLAVRQTEMQNLINTWVVDGLPSTDIFGTERLFYGFDTKELTLSKMNPKREKMLLNYWFSARNKYIMSLNTEEITPELMLKLDNVAMLLHIRGARADEGFERQMQATSMVFTSKNPNQQQKKGGFPIVGRLFNRGGS